VSATNFMDKAKTLQRRGDMAGAEANYRQVLTEEPDHAEALNNLGNVLRALKRPDEAVSCLRRALALKPEHPAVLTNLGLALGDLGRFNEAADCHRRATAADPSFAPGYNNLGLALTALGRLGEAEASYQRALALKPDFAEALNNLGNMLRVGDRLEEAASAYRRVLEINPGLADAHYSLAKVMRDLGRLKESDTHFRRGAELNPEHAEAHADRGRLLLVAGRQEEAHRAFAHAIARNPSMGEAHSGWINTLTEELDPGLLPPLEAIVQRSAGLAFRDRVAAHFALARAYDMLGRYDDAFRSLTRANRLKRARIAHEGALEREHIARLKQAFSRALISANSTHGSPSTVPIFIVGYLRSGTTLTEQILASHPQVHGAGELRLLADILPELTIQGPPRLEFPESMTLVPGHRLRDLGEAYVGRISALAPAARHITDKMPRNYALLGLIRVMLPGARIIHLRRNPVDACFSCYATNFSSPHAYTSDLRELGRHYRMYLDVMDHWRAVLPADSMLEISYETLVTDLEGQTRRILDYCGLPWDDRCLSFHETERPVRTASLSQVRRPLYRSAIGRWRHYEKHLQPLLEALGPAVVDYERSAQS
jgi:tetratricopeptide (TPR) repeat protein